MNWTLEKRKISTLKPNKKNARRLSKNDAQQLQRSIEKFGVCELVVINNDGTLIGGHQRVKVLKRMGYTEIDVHVPDDALTELECDELNIRLNKNIGSWDYDILGNEWEVDNLLDWGFLPDDLDIFVEDESEKEDESEPCPVCGKKMKKKK